MCLSRKQLNRLCTTTLLLYRDFFTWRIYDSGSNSSGSNSTTTSGSNVSQKNHSLRERVALLAARTYTRYVRRKARKRSAMIHFPLFFHLPVRTPVLFPTDSTYARDGDIAVMFKPRSRRAWEAACCIIGPY